MTYCSGFAEISKCDLLFHPDGSPNNILNIVMSEPIFSSSECEDLEDILSGIFTHFGDKVYDAAYPTFMKRMDMQLDA